MPAFGGQNPGYERYGGGTPNLKRLVDSLNSQRGTAYNTDQSSNVYAENMAYARAINHAWSDNNRLANQWDAQRMTDFLPRWEKIFGIVPDPLDSLQARRAVIANAFLRLGQQPGYQAVYDACLAAVGSDVFVGIVHTTSAAGVNGPAVVWTPDTTPAWPVGNVDPSHVLTWYSNIAHVLIQVQQPASMGDAEFSGRVGKLWPILDSFLPAWVTWDWFKVIHAGGTVKGFFLDEENLNVEVFGH